METKRIELYKEFITVFVDTLQLSKAKKTNPHIIKGLGIKLQTVGFRMSIISSDAVMEKYMKWKELTSDGSDPEAIVDAFAETLHEMRKEFLPTTKRPPTDVLEMLT